MRVAVLMGCLAVAACAGDRGPTYAEQLNQFVGRPEVEAVAALGAPSQSYETGGKKFLTWTSVRSRVVPGPYYPSFYGSGFYGGGYGRRGVGMGYSPGFWGPDRVLQDSCATTATVERGVVQGFSLNGACG